MHLSEPPKSASEILQAGDKAAELLNNTVYNLAHRSLIQSYQEQWMLTEPHERERREFLYHKIQAASEVATEMASMVNEAQSLNMDELKREELAQRME